MPLVKPTGRPNDIIERRRRGVENLSTNTSIKKIKTSGGECWTNLKFHKNMFHDVYAVRGDLIKAISYMQEETVVCIASCHYNTFRARGKLRGLPADAYVIIHETNNQRLE
jgi:hypothetical protein